MLRTWVFTVLTETNIDAAISSVGSMAAMPCSTSSSRLLSGSTTTGSADAGADGGGGPLPAGPRRGDGGFVVVAAAPPQAGPDLVHEPPLGFRGGQPQRPAQRLT